MSREYMVLIADEPPCDRCIEYLHAKVFMTFTERPDDDFLGRIAAQNPGKRVYCLLGASTWHGGA